MARNNSKALRIVVIGISLSHLMLKRFIEKGHIVLCAGDQECIEDGIENMDVIIGPRCWRIDPKLKLGDDNTEEASLERQLEMMEKGIRAIKYPKDKKDAKETTNPSH